MHFGIISPPVPGHIHPFGALGRELISRGHRVSFIHVPDVEARATNEELEFIPIGAAEYPPGALQASLSALGQRQGLSALQFTIGEITRTTRMMLRDAPSAIKRAGISALLVDQTEPAGGTIAEHLGLPFITICNALMLNRERYVPPPFTPWNFTRAYWAPLRNRLGYAVSDWFTGSIRRVVREYRREWGLPAHNSPDDSFSKIAQISQQPALFDFPRRNLPAVFRYVGPLRRPSLRRVDFPWDRIGSRPLVYASLGTLQNRRPGVFQMFADACEGLGVQLVMAHGGGLSVDAEGNLPEHVIAVPFAPQLEVLARATLTLSHAGLNTVLDSLTFGVPLIAMPITFEQPAIARRVTYRKVGTVIPFDEVSVPSLRSQIKRMLHANSPFRKNACEMAEAIRSSGGVNKAADIILSLV